MDERRGSAVRGDNSGLVSGDRDFPDAVEQGSDCVHVLLQVLSTDGVFKRMLMPSDGGGDC